jgi:hypothetical protein
MKMQAENDMLKMEIQKCTDDYIDNRCFPGERVKALEEYCT